VTAVGLGADFAVGFALAHLLGVGVTDALIGAAVVAGASLDEPSLEAAALETGALEAGLETAGPAEEATPLAPLNARDGVASGAA